MDKKRTIAKTSVFNFPPLRPIDEIPKRFGGGRGIRTPGTVAGSVVFKTTAIDRSAIPPYMDVPRHSIWFASPHGARRLRHLRSEERRVGKECRTRLSAYS